MYQQVTLYSQDKSGSFINCYFQSQKTLEKFEKNYQHMGGALNFVTDIIDEHEKMILSIPLISANNKGWNKVLSVLYPSIVK